MTEWPAWNTNRGGDAINALHGLWDMIDKCILVKGTKNDDDFPVYAREAMELINALKMAREVLLKEGRIEEEEDEA